MSAQSICANHEGLRGELCPINLRQNGVFFQQVLWTLLAISLNPQSGPDLAAAVDKSLELAKADPSISGRPRFRFTAATAAGLSRHRNGVRTHDQVVYQGTVVSEKERFHA